MTISDPRNTPTVVGKAFGEGPKSFFAKAFLQRDHPNGCREVFFDHQLPRLTPHVVGRHFGDSVTFDELWITSTRVGKTTIEY